MKLSGKVIKGQGLATAMFGVPTANLEVNHSLALKPGVYAAKAFVQNEWRLAVAYMSPSTLNMLEVHIFDFKGDLLHGQLSVEVLDGISDHVVWEGEEQMKAKIFDDLRKAREYFGLN
jgi:riboflavin kinase/FMN adenylyltransferase